MRKRFGGLLLTVGMWLLPGPALAQYYEVPPATGYLPGPLGHPRYEDGGFYVAVEGLFLRQTNPLREQQVAVRGFIDADGTISGVAGSFRGSGNQALNVEQIDGPGSFQPGFNLIGGWRFDNGVALRVSWMHLWESRYAATASILPPNFKMGPNLADTFLFAPVFNFPADFAGQAVNVSGSGPGSTFGIWNAASLMGIDFVQRFNMLDITGRIPVWQTDNRRSYGLIGPRMVWFWERFRWRTVSADSSGNAGADDVAIYSNVVSNRLYGMHGGGGYEWWLGDTPAGGFALTLDGELSLYVDFVKERAKYERGDRLIAYSRARNVYNLVPGLETKAALWWYPWEAVQVRVGYDLLVFFNTVASRRPIDFDFGTIAPYYDSQTRWLHGLTFGIAFVF